MADITMCMNDECVLTVKCYRYNAEADIMQSYSNFEGGKDCEYFWSMKRSKNIETKEK